MREESYAGYIKRAQRRKQRRLQQQQQQAFVTDIADDDDTDEDLSTRNEKFWELAKHEGDEKWLEWIETHIWTYVGLSAPMMGAVNPLRAIISGENMYVTVTNHHILLGLRSAFWQACRLGAFSFIDKLTS